MDTNEQNAAWLARVEDLINMLEGTTVSELELTEAGTEIIIRRQSGMVMVAAPTQYAAMDQVGAPGQPHVAARAPKEDAGVAIATPLTGVYYSSPSPSSPPFVLLGDIVHVGQVIALVEAMKVFNEIQAEVSGRVVAMVATNGEVVQKGDALIRIQPA